MGNVTGYEYEIECGLFYPNEYTEHNGKWGYFAEYCGLVEIRTKDGKDYKPKGDRN